MTAIRDGSRGICWRLATFMYGLSFACAGQTQATDPNPQPQAEPKPWLEVSGSDQLDAESLALRLSSSELGSEAPAEMPGSRTPPARGTACG